MRRIPEQAAGAVLALALGLAAGAACAESAPAREERTPVRFETEDGFVLRGDLLRARDPSAPAVILLHMYHSDRSAWAPLLPDLAEAGLTVLALDQRAHGESTRQGERTVRVAEIPRERFGAFVRDGPRDVAAARAHLATLGLAPRRIFLIGASYGCSVALLSAGRVEDVGGLVLLSPGTAYFDVDVVEAAAKFPGPLLAVAAEDDPRSAASARRLTEVHAGPDELTVYESGGHGTHLFASRRELVPRIVSFLGEALD